MDGGGQGADRGGTNYVKQMKQLKALTTKGQIIRRQFWIKNCREHFLGREFPGRVSKGETAQSAKFLFDLLLQQYLRESDCSTK